MSVQVEKLSLKNTFFEKSFRKGLSTISPKLSRSQTNINTLKVLKTFKVSD